MVSPARPATVSPCGEASLAGEKHQFTRVLLVDDHIESATQTKAILEQRGLEVRWARDGGQAHQMLPMYKPECVIAELILPGESGFELCEWMKLWKRDLPLIVYSEIDLPSAHQLAQRLGADAYIDKPVAAETLFRVMDEVAETAWERAHKINNPSEEVAIVKFHCLCGAKLRKEASESGRFITCPQCRGRVIVPHLGTEDMLCVHSELVPTPRNEQDQFWRVTMRYMTVKCRYCATFFRLFTSDRSQCTICPKCNKMQLGSLSTGRAPMTEAALTNSLRVLQVLTGRHRGKRIMLPRHEVMLGRTADCEIRRQSCGWSDHQCALRPSVRGVIVRDLGSATGTKVNGQIIRKETVLAPGGLLQVGRVLFRLLKPEWHGPDETTGMDRGTVPVRTARTTQSSVRAEGTVFEFQNTAGAAAVVIQEYWETCRQRALQQLRRPPTARTSVPPRMPSQVRPDHPRSSQEQGQECAGPPILRQQRWAGAVLAPRDENAGG